MATYKSFADLTEQQKQQFGDEASYKSFMDANITTPQQTPMTELSRVFPSSYTYYIYT